MKKKGDQSIWVWIQKMEGWFWTTKDHYPALHSSSSQTWYWVSLEQSDFTRLVIFDYSNCYLDESVKVSFFKAIHKSLISISKL